MIHKNIHKLQTVSHSCITITIFRKPGLLTYLNNYVDLCNIPVLNMYASNQKW